MEVVMTTTVVGCRDSAVLREYWFDHEAYQKLLEHTYTGVPHSPNWNLREIQHNNGHLRHGSWVYVVAAEPSHFFEEVYGDAFYRTCMEEKTPWQSAPFAESPSSKTRKAKP